ncbi:kinase-like protein, partial [Pluteus cervinus]
QPVEPIPRSVGNWWLAEKLGSGYSGYIYRAVHIYTRQECAIKLQYINHDYPTNKVEKRFYRTLQGGKGMPMLWADGLVGVWDYLCIDLLGPSIDSLLRRSGRDYMDLRSVCSIAMQLISRLETMHARGVLHRDIQLGNCTIGLGQNERTLYMIDFGFSATYLDQKTRRHVPEPRRKQDFIGNYYFSSVRVHCRGKLPSRRDDLEAAALMLIHLLTPRGLSWTRNGPPKTEEAHDQLKLEKASATPQQLCRSLPAEFEDFLTYCRNLRYSERPDYGMWIEEFRDLASYHGYGESDELIWPPPPPKAQPARNSETPRRIREGAPAPEDLTSVLNGLAKLDFQQIPALVNDQKKIQAAIEHVKGDSSNVTGEGWGDRFNTKATRLAKLTKQAPEATDNKLLSDLVQEFIAALQCNTSRTMTKEGFRFIDALHKQLADPSVFVAPPSKSKSLNSQVSDAEAQPTRVKLNLLAQLRKDVPKAKDNQALADMVTDFCRITQNSKTITKDGFAFLDGLAVRLKTLG